MLEQIKQAVDEFDALDIVKSGWLVESDALHKRLDKLRMDLYTFHRELDTALVKGISDDKWTDLLDNIRETNAVVKETEKAYQEARKQYSHAWPKADLARKKVEKLRKKFWEQKD